MMRTIERQKRVIAETQLAVEDSTEILSELEESAAFAREKASACRRAAREEEDASLPPRREPQPGSRREALERRRQLEAGAGQQTPQVSILSQIWGGMLFFVLIFCALSFLLLFAGRGVLFRSRPGTGARSTEPGPNTSKYGFVRNQVKMRVC